jgi:threonine dehydrogenase-like Zn-dependent dehydrogenase
MARLGVGGPGLSNAAFAHGVGELRKTMTDTHEERLDFERQRNTKTFTDFHGEALAQQMHRLCGVTSDVNLPEVHSLLLQMAKGRIYTVLTSLFATRGAQALPVPLNVAMMAPVASTKLVDDMFNSMQALHNY